MGDDVGRGETVQFEMFPVERPSIGEIVERALAHKPVAVFAMLSGGDGSLAATHWAMNNIPGCEVLHINTGIGIERTRLFVRETCARGGSPLDRYGRTVARCSVNGVDVGEYMIRGGWAVRWPPSEQ